MSDKKQPIFPDPELHTVINPRFAVHQRPASRTWKGPKGAPWFSKTSQYGCMYKCAYCGKESRGIGGRMHWTGCPNTASPWSYMPKGDGKGTRIPFSGKRRRPLA